MTPKSKTERKGEAAQPAVPMELVEIEIPLARSSSAAHVKKAVASLNFITELKEHGDTVTVSVVETRDINKNPYLYYEFAFRPSGIKCTYSVTPEVNASQRRINVSRSLLAMLSLLGDSYGTNLGPLYTMLQKALDDASTNVTLNSQQLMNKCDVLQRANAALTEKQNKMKEAYENLNNAFLELEKRNELVDNRVKQLEGMTDIELKEELQRWIFEHDGAIKYSDFAKTFNIPQSRVEEGIDMLLKEGFIVRSS